MKILAMNLAQIVIVPNLYDSAKSACDAWLSGRMWGRPIRMGADKFHVYGALRGEWTPMNVEFLPDKIMIMIPNCERRSG